MKENWIDRIALRIRPEIRAKTGLERAGLLLDMSSLVSITPALIAGIIWLILVTDFEPLAQNWLGLIFYFILVAVFYRYTFELRLQMTKSVFATASGSLEPMISWSGALIFGPAILWLNIILYSAIYAYRIRRESSIDMRWVLVRNYETDLTYNIIGTLVGLTVYQWLGGELPFPGLTWPFIWAGFVATLAYVLAVTILFMPFARRLITITGAYQGETITNPLAIIRFLLFGINMSFAALPFAILAAGLYSDNGLGIYLFFTIAVFLSAVLAHRLSEAVAYSEQRSKELAVLESLGRAIIDAPPGDADVLPDLLADNLAGMLPLSLIYIWLYPDKTLYQSPGVTVFPQESRARELAQQGSAPYYQLSKVRLPEETIGQITRNGLVVPVMAEDGAILGGICVLKREDYGEVMDYLAAIQSLAAQIAAALRRIEVYAQTVESERMTRELEIAGQIQASFLPDQVPQVPGWEISAILEPARQTSGDFYDFVDLGDGRMGVLVADVADKGTGAALYMALSRTLIRTYAMEHPGNPEMALQIANERILQDTESDQFVTVFFAVLEANNGRLIYANAGHNPAYLFNSRGVVEPQALGHTGIPLGMFPEMRWQQHVVQMDPGDVLVLYTDGVTEAQDDGGQEFGDKRLLGVVDSGLIRGLAAQEVATQILHTIRQFVGGAPQFDDITLLLLQRSS